MECQRKVMITPNALESVRRVESEAEGVIEDANKKAESIKRKALEEGEKVKRQLVDEANKKVSDYRKKKEKETDGESSDIISKAKQQVGDLKSKSETRIPMAVDAVIKIAMGD